MTAEKPTHFVLIDRLLATGRLIYLHGAPSADAAQAWIDGHHDMPTLVAALERDRERMIIVEIVSVIPAETGIKARAEDSRKPTSHTDPQVAEYDAVPWHRYREDMTTWGRDVETWRTRANMAVARYREAERRATEAEAEIAHLKNEMGAVRDAFAAVFGPTMDTLKAVWAIVGLIIQPPAEPDPFMEVASP